MNEKRLSVKELITAYNKGFGRRQAVDAGHTGGTRRNVQDRGRALPGPCPVLGRKMVRALSQGGPARTADKTAAWQAPFCFQEDHEEDLEGGQEDHLLDGQGPAGSDQDDVRRRV